MPQQVSRYATFYLFAKSVMRQYATLNGWCITKPQRLLQLSVGINTPG